MVYERQKVNFVILHGTDADHASNWFPWLKAQLEALGHNVWVPDLPGADRPDPKRYNEYLLSQGWDFNDAVLIGHSSGALEILALVSALPAAIKIKTAIMIGSFTERMLDDPSWEMLSELFSRPFDLDAIKQRVGNFIFVHSEDDPYCPIGQAEELNSKLGGEFIRFKDKGHFCLNDGPEFVELPELLEIIEQKVTA